MHIYAFGSICRGDIDQGSDIDLLALVEGHDDRFDPDVYSIYSYQRIKEIWADGNPFAWHLHLEAKLLFAQNSNNYLHHLGEPHPYNSGHADCKKFYRIFKEACQSYKKSSGSTIFDLSSIFLAIRNFATCYSLAYLKKPNFSRDSAIHLESHNLNISVHAYEVLKRARLLCTRAIGKVPCENDIKSASMEFIKIERWMLKLMIKESSSSG